MNDFKLRVSYLGLPQIISPRSSILSLARRVERNDVSAEVVDSGDSGHSGDNNSHSEISTERNSVQHMETANDSSYTETEKLRGRLTSMQLPLIN